MPRELSLSEIFQLGYYWETKILLTAETLDVFIKGGAGGPYRLPGDYVWANGRLPYVQSGQWGYFRVLPTTDTRIQPLGGVRPGRVAEAEQPGSGQAEPVAYTR